MAALFLTIGFISALVFVPQLTGQLAGAIDDIPAPDIAESNILLEQERIFNEIYNKVSPAVVAITTAARPAENSNFLPVATGSGFVVDTDGHIVTNYHVVTDASRVEVALYDGTIARADVVGEDPDSDIAVIRLVDVPPDRIHPVAFADSDQLRVGQTVLALGNPFQNDWTLTSGIISALNRRIIGLSSYSIGGVIQTDAAINPGNSGGPLLNLRGEVIGVNSQIESETRSNSGVGFAVPSNLVRKVASSLIDNGSIEYSYIGISSREIDLDLIEQFSLPNNIRGVAVRQVLPDTPAASAGLHSIGNSTIDVITAINGRPVADFDEMIGYLSINTNPGDSVTLTVYRNGEVLELTVTLTSR
jgi:2-alkenal reductase